MIGLPLELEQAIILVTYVGAVAKMRMLLVFVMRQILENSSFSMNYFKVLMQRCMFQR